MPYKDPEEQRAAQRAWYQARKGLIIAQRKRRREDLRLKVNEYKLKRGCDRCGYARSAAALDAHHRDPQDKLFTISRAVQDLKGLDLIFEELGKCDLICANCHREQHATDGTIGVNTKHLSPSSNG